MANVIVVATSWAEVHSTTASGRRSSKRGSNSWCAFGYPLSPRWMTSPSMSCWRAFQSACVGPARPAANGSERARMGDEAGVGCGAAAATAERAAPCRTRANRDNGERMRHEDQIRRITDSLTGCPAQGQPLLRIASSGAASHPVINSTWRAAWCSSRSKPPMLVLAGALRRRSSASAPGRRPRRRRRGHAGGPALQYGAPAPRPGSSTRAPASPGCGRPRAEVDQSGRQPEAVADIGCVGVSGSRTAMVARSPPIRRRAEAPRPVAPPPTTTTSSTGSTTAVAEGRNEAVDVGVVGPVPLLAADDDGVDRVERLCDLVDVVDEADAARA